MHFYKYQATGNDFIVVDNRVKGYFFSKDQITHLCHRKWGIGADGFITINRAQKEDFKVDYYNPDGTQSLCGNGCRVAVLLAAQLGICTNSTTFFAFDGVHQAVLLGRDYVRLKMNDVQYITPEGDDFCVDTGSPHYVRFVQRLRDYNVQKEARSIRYNEKFRAVGVNVNFVETCADQTIVMRTYERGVEKETLSCGTGAVAVAVAVASVQGHGSPITVQTQGGKLQIEFNLLAEGGFSEIFITGPATMTFEGDVVL